MHSDHDQPAPARERLFGVCAALGNDFGFNPLWLRLGFAAALLFNLEIVLATYVALGVAVIASRLVFPDRRATQAVTPSIAPAPATVVMPAEEYRQAA